MDQQRLRQGWRRLVRSPILPFAALSLFLLWAHEPWRDEAEAWLIARDTPTLGAFFHAMRYEGTPVLWHLLLRLLSHAGLPFLSARILHAAIAVAGVALVWSKAPFRPWEKWMLSFGYYAAYEYDAITRSYALLGLLLFVVALAHRQRHERPLRYGLSLALLANVTLHGLIVAGILAAAHGIDLLRRRAWSWRATQGGAIAATSFALAIYGMRQPPDLARLLSEWHVSPWDLPKSFAASFLPLPGGLHPFWNTSFLGSAPGAVKLLAFVVLLAGACWTLREDRWVLGIYLVAVAALEALFVFRYYGGLHHAGVLFLVYVFCLWLARDSLPWPRREPTLAGAGDRGARAAAAFLVLVLGAQVTAAAVAVVEDGTGSFSGSGATARYLEEHGYVGNGTFLAFYRSFTGMGVLAQLQDTDARAYSPEFNAFQSYTPWSQTHRDGYYYTLPEVLAKVDAADDGYGRTILVVYEHVLGDAVDHSPRLTHLATFGADSIGSDELFDVYEVLPP